jgi:hypothetical protein
MQKSTIDVRTPFQRHATPPRTKEGAGPSQHTVRRGSINALLLSFQLYAGGVCDNPSSTARDPDHGVLAVECRTDSGLDFSIVKSSAGTRWGEQSHV